MDDISKDEVKRALGKKDELDYFSKKVSIIKDSKHYTIRIPKKFGKDVGIKEKRDKFKFTLIPIDEGFTLKGEFVRGK